MSVTEAVENYLETILVLSKTHSEIHAIDICSELGFSRPTVSEMLKQLKGMGFVSVDNMNHIRLTESGISVAERILERHTVIASMLISLGVDEKNAYADACKIEHDISDISFECIKKHYPANKK